jgi:hypothetical protein
MASKGITGDPVLSNAGIAKSMTSGLSAAYISSKTCR